MWDMNALDVEYKFRMQGGELLMGTPQNHRHLIPTLTTLIILLTTFLYYALNNSPKIIGDTDLFFIFKNKILIMF